MPRKRQRRSAAQARQTEAMNKRHWASPEEADKISEVYRCVTLEEYRDRMAKAEREAEKNHRNLRNAERRVREAIQRSVDLPVDTDADMC
jgi:hypothetical protein